MADTHLTYCESLQEWTTRCTCDEGLPCADCGIDPCACEPMAVGIVDKGLVAR